MFVSFLRIRDSVDGERQPRETLDIRLDWSKLHCIERSTCGEGRWTIVDLQSMGSFIVWFQ